MNEAITSKLKEVDDLIGDAYRGAEELGSEGRQAVAESLEAASAKLKCLLNDPFEPACPLRQTRKREPSVSVLLHPANDQVRFNSADTVRWLEISDYPSSVHVFVDAPFVENLHKLCGEWLAKNAAEVDRAAG